MNDIIGILRSHPDFLGSNGTNEEKIYDAESSLKIKFSSDYRKYLKEIGLCCFDGHELTGITDISRLSVVDVTLLEREHNPDVLSDWYVIEQANIDGIVIWQNEQGEIFQTQPCAEPVKIANTLEEYISREL